MMTPPMPREQSTTASFTVDPKPWNRAATFREKVAAQASKDAGDRWRLGQSLRIIAHWAAVAMLLCAATSCVVFPALHHRTGFLADAQLTGCNRADVLRQLGLPAAVTNDGSRMLFAVPDANWVLGIWPGVYHDIDAHWDVRFVVFAQDGTVRSATPVQQRQTSLQALVDELRSETWSK
jgi:hypothetical protein